MTRYAPPGICRGRKRLYQFTAGNRIGAAARRPLSLGPVAGAERPVPPDEPGDAGEADRDEVALMGAPRSFSYASDGAAQLIVERDER